MDPEGLVAAAVAAIMDRRRAEQRIVECDQIRNAAYAALVNLCHVPAVAVSAAVQGELVAAGWSASDIAQAGVGVSHDTVSRLAKLARSAG
jgi:hypothetical protein